MRSGISCPLTWTEAGVKITMMDVGVEYAQKQQKEEGRP